MIPSFFRRAAGVLFACSLPFAALAAPSPDAAASQPKSPTAGSRIASKCHEMTGAERTACERDIHADAKKHRNGSHPMTPAAAASSSH